ncbi:MAG: hypothetical protein GY820_10340 [Gammaproteobacteria bacterium]|nr:hypothetical protein [Gammaproteobacteria bacterium]
MQMRSLMEHLIKGTIQLQERLANGEVGMQEEEVQLWVQQLLFFYYLPIAIVGTSGQQDLLGGYSCF